MRNYYRQAYDKAFILARIDVNPETGCWEWNRNRAKNRYGLVVMGKVHRGAHQLAYELWKGPRNGLHVLHECDNPPCCNPGHLFLGTRKENMADANAKGRIPKGEVHWNSKLTEANIRAIRSSEIRDGGKTLGPMFGVSPKTIRKIRSRFSWKHVP